MIASPAESFVFIGVWARRAMEGPLVSSIIGGVKGLEKLPRMG